MTVDLMVGTTSTSTACCAAARTAPGGATTPTTTELAPLSASRILGVGGRRGLFVLLAGYGAPLLCVACTRGMVVGISERMVKRWTKKTRTLDDPGRRKLNISADFSEERLEI